MKPFILLILVVNCCFGQKQFVIIDEYKASIVGASIFLIGKTNELVAVSNNQGEINLNLVDSSKYLVHSVGFVDTEFTTNQLQKTSIIELKAVVYQLREVKASLLKSYIIRKPILSKTAFTILDLPQDANTQRVVSIKIDTPGYIKEFKLFCKIYMKDLAPDYRFILLSQKDGKPDSLLAQFRIEGLKSKKEIVFDLSKANFYLEKGNYFIGYETFNGKAVIKKQIHNDKKLGQMISVPIIIYRGEENKISFERTNLSKWVIPRLGKKIDGKLVWDDDLNRNFAYELEMLY